ncbi:ran-specific GTPase-activating protein [Solea senegalensis]|uniref:Ran-specific GTPase-activating protein n=1 Tax=Solea senegalensis TaxID=28829 RepID=A0AAV6QVN1_SOLSE|nr:ran-specific GTPase-activating protein [Solea senegalensis]KAG7496393.1 ran-specific GTPase-activating protein [Solea senegalensis]
MADPKDQEEQNNTTTTTTAVVVAATTTTEGADETNHDPHFEPIVSLPEQDVKTLEEDEVELFKMRAKLYRFASENDPPEWKERGTGDVKMLKHKEKGTIRLLMRRDRTLKICANHHILPTMELKPNAGSDRAWVWNTLADYADECPKPELLAIRFLNAENAQKFKVKFDECKEEAKKNLQEMGDGDSTNKVVEKLEELSVKDKVSEDKKEEVKKETEKKEDEKKEVKAEEKN